MMPSDGFARDELGRGRTTWLADGNGVRETENARTCGGRFARTIK